MDDDDPKRLSTRIQMLATLVATATYAAGFNPPGGMWQDIHAAAGHLPVDPIMRSTHHLRYAVFFYCNAIAFTVSLIIVVLTLFVHTNTPKPMKKKINLYTAILMALAMVAFTVTYGAGACRTKLTIIWYCILVPFPFFFVMYLAFVHWQLRKEEETATELKEVEVEVEKEKEEEKEDRDYFRAFQRLVIPLSMFALTITYVAGLSTPGGFWDSAEGGHHPGDAILGDRFQGRTLRWFLTLNTTAFLASLYALSLLMVHVKKLRERYLLFCIFALVCLLIGLLGAYIVGNSRGRVNWPLYGEVFACMVAYVVVHVLVKKTAAYYQVPKLGCSVLRRLVQRCRADAGSEDGEAARQQLLLVQLMAGLAVAITYQAGLYPPGGLWADDADGHTAGDPILLTTKARRYRGFHYCNSVSFVASLLAMFLVQKRTFHEHHALQAAMLLDMLGLVGAYAIGSCRDQVSTLYVAGLAGAGVVYVFVHVFYFTLGGVTDNGGAEGEGDFVDHFGGRLLLFAVLVASITYQAGLTPPGGFLLNDDAQSGHHAGDPVLLYNYPRRYRAFFYCNSVSFMLSIVLIVLLVKPNQYRTAIQSHALSVCSAVSYVCLMGAFAAGSTQHRKGSYFIIVLAGLSTLLSAALFFKYWDNAWWMVKRSNQQDPNPKYKEKSEYLMTLAILVASATYPAALDPPGGSWQSSSDGHDAGNPVMHDSRRHRYIAFFVGNTVSFLASLMLILVLLVAMLLKHKHRHEAAPQHEDEAHRKHYWKWVNGGLVSLQCLGFLVAYAAGSSRRWKTSAHIGTIVSAVLLFLAIHLGLSFYRTPPESKQQQGQPSDQGGVQTPAQTAPGV